MFDVLSCGIALCVRKYLEKRTEKDTEAPEIRPKPGNFVCAVVVCWEGRVGVAIQSSERHNYIG